MRYEKGITYLSATLVGGQLSNAVVVGDDVSLVVPDKAAACSFLNISIRLAS